MKTRLTVTVLTVLCCLAWAAEDAVVAPQAATSFEPQAPSYEADAITIPKMLSYQGKLTDTGGNPVRDSTYSVVFRLYTVSSGGTAFWDETQNVQTKSGLFTVLLGSVTPIGYVPDAGALYLGMQVGAAELTPRLRLVSAAYAYKADSSAWSAAAAPVGAAGGDLAGSYPNPTIGQKGAATGQVLKWTGSAWQPRNDSVGGGSGDNAWVRGSPDSVLYTVNRLGVAKGGASNMLYGTQRQTHVNFGVACTTGTSGNNYPSITVAGGLGNTAGGYGSTVGGGEHNHIVGGWSAIAGGDGNVTGDYDWIFMGAGYMNKALSSADAVCAGRRNYCDGGYSFLGSGEDDTLTSSDAVLCGGYINRVSGSSAFLGAGERNRVTGQCGVLAGGSYNSVSASHATVAGGYADTVAGKYGLAAGIKSVVRSADTNSVAFNGTTTSGHRQTRVYSLVQGFGAMGIDHPLDPRDRILNQYTMASSEMVLFYRGAATIGGNGRVSVELPGHFDALCRNPMVQLTGVGTPDVYVAEDVSGNRFAIGGPAGAKVYWQVTGERKDPAAEQARADLPVEQQKTGELQGRSVNGLW